MPVSKQRQRQCKYCGKLYTLGIESTQHKYCSIECRSKWHYNRWKSGGGIRDKAKIRAYWLKSNYNLSLDQYNQLLSQQDHKCPICFTTEPRGYNWHVDHNHTTGKIRGLLCCTCNQGLGLFQESINILESAKKYLENS